MRFTELVTRHVDMVYSVAKRHVAADDLAQDVTQSVFVELARHCRRIDPSAPLVAWLHVVARRQAIDLVRRETARHRRELQAAAQNMNAEPEKWAEIEPLLDEAVESLAPEDRTAVLLRFFSNKSLREVGIALGISEDSAQKRVSRALDRLRATLVRRGVVVTGAGLATELSAHALQLAPAGLGSAVAAGALSGVSAAVPVADALAMTTVHKIALGTALAVAASAVVFEAHSYEQHRRELAALTVQTTAARAQLDALRTQNKRDAEELVTAERALDSTLAQLSRKGDDPLAAQARVLQARYNGMKDLLASRPSLSIPELALLSDEDWWAAAATLTADSEPEFRRGLARLRADAQNLISSRVTTAFEKYAETHDGRIPESMQELTAYIRAPITPEMFARYEILASGTLAQATKNRQAIAVTTPCDPEYDTLCLWRPPLIIFQRAMDYNIRQAQSQFATANNGRRSTAATDLLPYLKWPVPLSTLEKFLTPTR